MPLLGLAANHCAASSQNEPPQVKNEGIKASEANGCPALLFVWGKGGVAPKSGRDANAEKTAEPGARGMQFRACDGKHCRTCCQTWGPCREATGRGSGGAGEWESGGGGEEGKDGIKRYGFNERNANQACFRRSSFLASLLLPPPHPFFSKGAKGREKARLNSQTEQEQ